MADKESQREMLLSDVLESIRTDLVESAKKRAPNWEPLFEIEDLEVELYVRIKKDSKVKGGIKAYVIDFGAEGAEGSELGHRIKLRLKSLGKGEREDAAEVPSGRGQARPELRG
jgi:hypothetical protein